MPVVPARAPTVGFLFGVLGARAVPGTVLVPLLTDLHMSGDAARTLLHRMLLRGLLSVDHVGRVAIYRMAGSYAAHYQRITFEGPRLRWGGGFHALVYDIPETRRQDRDRLRDQAFLAGFGAPRSGLLIGVNEPGEWADVWLDRGDVFVGRVRLDCDLATAKRLADRAWGLRATAARIDETRDWLEAAERRLRAYDVAGGPALATLGQVWDRYIRVQLDIPSLPHELYPDHWEAEDMQARVFRLNGELLPPARRHARTVIERAGASTLVDYEPRAARSERALPRKGT